MVSVYYHGWSGLLFWRDHGSASSSSSSHSSSDLENALPRVRTQISVIEVPIPSYDEVMTVKTPPADVTPPPSYDEAVTKAGDAQDREAGGA